MPEHDFKFKPSRFYLLVLGVVLIASIGITFCLPVALWMKAGGMLLEGAYLSHIIWRFGMLRSQYSILAIQRLSEDKWRLQMPQVSHEAELCGDSTVTSVVSVLRFRLAERKWPVACVVFRDSLDADDYRKLLVAVR